MSYPGNMRHDGLSDPAAIEIPARQLLGTACVRGGADCPLFDTGSEADTILARVGSDPSLSIRLTSDADCIPHYSTLDRADFAALDRDALLNRKRDLDVLQRLGLCPGDTRRARYLYEKLLSTVESPVGICACDTPNWEGCPLARSGAYEHIRGMGWRTLVFDRTETDRANARRQSVERVRNDPVLKIRAHHLMCMCCWVGAAGGEGTRPNDTLDEVYKRICADPDVDVMLVEGNCEACHCCDGFHPDSTRCVHAGGLIRDFKKDLDVLQKLGLLPGATLNARKAVKLIFERIPSTTDICGFGDDVVRGEAWTVCGGPGGNQGYLKARETVRF